MKQILTAIILLFTVTLSVSAEKGPEITFGRTLIDLGSFPMDRPVRECEYTFKNTGDSPLVIIKVSASCGCTSLTYSRQPIQPGEQGTIRVVYNGKNRPLGHFTKTITVITNTDPKSTTLRLKGQMLKP